jgi:hypothetical protein
VIYIGTIITLKDYRVTTFFNYIELQPPSYVDTGVTSIFDVCVDGVGSFNAFNACHAMDYRHYNGLHHVQ